jgi:hypothetical protein
VDHLGRAQFDRAANESIPPLPPTPTVYHLIQSWPDHWPFEDSHFPDNPHNLILAIPEGWLSTVHGVCDGSYMPKLAMDLGAAAWIIEDPLLDQTGYVWYYSNFWQGSRRGLVCILGLLAFCTLHHIGEEGKATLGCDNNNCVQHGWGDWQKVSLSTAHANLIRAICVLKHKFPLVVEFEHVYGHCSR